MGDRDWVPFKKPRKRFFVRRSGVPGGVYKWAPYPCVVTAFVPPDPNPVHSLGRLKLYAVEYKAVGQAFRDIRNEKEVFIKKTRAQKKCDRLNADQLAILERRLAEKEEKLQQARRPCRRRRFADYEIRAIIRERNLAAHYVEWYGRV